MLALSKMKIKTEIKNVKNLSFTMVLFSKEISKSIMNHIVGKKTAVAV